MKLERRHVFALAAAGVLFVATWAMRQAPPGIEIGFVPGFTNSTPGELLFWLLLTFFITPAGALLGYGLAPVLEAPLGQVWTRVDAMNRDERRMGLAVLTIVAFALAQFAHHFVLLGYPLTDDEWSLRFGGQILATGHATMPLPEGYKAMPDLYLFVREGRVTSFDWLGGQLAWAASILTGTGGAVFHLFAALATLGVTWVLALRLGAAWALVGAGLMLFSPMGFFLSATTHAHLQSRGLIAVSLGLLLVAEDRRKFGWWAALGFTTGLSIITRPFETAFSLAPIYIDLLWRARKDPHLRLAWLALVAGSALPLAGFLAHQHAVTGNPLLPARFAKNEIVPFGGAKTRPPLATFTRFDVFWERFGKNMAPNFFALLIWAGTGIGAVFAFLGLRYDRFTRLLGWCLLSSLTLALIHDNPGIHTAGPMHYSEAVVFAVILAVHGVKVSHEFLARHSLRNFPQTAAVLGAFVLTFASFLAWHGMALREQSRIHVSAYQITERPELRGKVVLSPRYFQIWGQWYFARKVGSFVFQWRPISPLKDESAVFVHDVPEAIEGLRRDYPNRDIVRLARDERGNLRIEPVAPSLESERRGTPSNVAWPKAEERAPEGAPGPNSGSGPDGAATAGAP